MYPHVFEKAIGVLWTLPYVRPSLDTNEYLGGYIWRTVSIYLNGIFSVDT